ncbi:MAG: hypothetical protein ACI9TF_001723 [Paracrocinitomix sp.]|jgi:hypothetical protein
MDDAVEHEVIVRALLAAAGLDIPEDEVGRLAQMYPGLRRSVDRYYDVPVLDEVTAAVFRADDQDLGGER